MGEELSTIMFQSYQETLQLGIINKCRHSKKIYAFISTIQIFKCLIIFIFVLMNIKIKCNNQLICLAIYVIVIILNNLKHKLVMDLDLDNTYAIRLSEYMDIINIAFFFYGISLIYFNDACSNLRYLICGLIFFDVFIQTSLLVCEFCLRNLLIRTSIICYIGTHIEDNSSILSS